MRWKQILSILLGKRRSELSFRRGAAIVEETRGLQQSIKVVKTMQIVWKDGYELSWKLCDSHDTHGSKYCFGLLIKAGCTCSQFAP